MNLKNILLGIEGIKGKGDIDIEINSIKNDSRKVEQGDVFVSIRGFVTDGANYIEEAMDNGAKVIVVDQDTDLKQIKTQKFLSELMKTLLYYEASQTLEWFTERACDSSTLGDTQAP